MTLDEAIKHCEEKAKELREQPFKEKMDIEEVADCEECAEEHEQLAEWLKELKAYKEASKGDLISRTELKKCAIPCEIHNGALTDLCVPLYQIDNAPTVFDDKAYSDGYTQGTCDCEHAHERQKGEWKINLTTGDIFCSCCKEVRRDTRIKHINFCNSCGADMRGDKE